ncbi:MAG: phosphonate-binding protein, partial [Pseudomonadota bacterium]|nr:phosphonate-binding protein [Pseudomonadota bacterium]
TALTALPALPAPPPSPRLLSAFSVRAVGNVVAGVELLESLAERQAVGKGVLTEADLAALGVSLEEAKALTTALKWSRAQKPDRDDRPKAVKDSPFAALSALTEPSIDTKRRRPPRRRRAKAL